METKFTADQFTTSVQYTGEEKAKFANHFVRFVRSDFKGTLFPKWFYTRLSMTFGHIAHYNLAGFYATFFETTQGKVEFLRQCAAYGCWGDPAYTYSDVGKALQPFVRDQIRDYVTRLSQEIEASERSELARLEAKYPKNN